MLVQRDNPKEADAVDEAMAWHGGDARATIEALLKDRERLQDQLFMAQACMSRGFTRGWMPGQQIEK